MSADGAAPRERAAAAVRTLAHALVGRRLDDAFLEEVASVAGGWGAAASAAPERRRPDDGLRDDLLRPEPDDGAPLEHFAECPVSGPANPLAFDLRAHREGSEVVVRTCLGPAHEGAPGRAHGGVVAALIDDTMGFVIGDLLREPAFVGELRIRYVAPTPIGVPLELRGGVLARMKRKLLIGATLRAGGRELATATGLHICVGLDRVGPPPGVVGAA